MPIGTVALSNTFNEFRTSVNDVINTLNSVVSASGVVSANTLTLTGTTDSSSNTTGTLIVAGGAGIAKKLYVGTEINLGDDKLLQVGRVRTTSNSTGGYILQNDNSPLRLGANNSFPLQVTVGSGVAASNVDITTNLTVAQSLNVNGNAIINVTDNTNAALRITQMGMGNALLVEDSNNPDSSPFMINSSGQVVVGDTSLYTSAGVTGGLQVTGSSADSATIAINSFRNSTNGPFLTLSHSKSGVNGTQTALVQNDAVGLIRFSGSDGTAFIQAAAIDGFVDGTPGTNDMPGRLLFSTTAEGASSPTERMRIDSAGGVGIGASASAGQTLYLGKNIAGSINSTAVRNQGIVQSDVTNSVVAFDNVLQTAPSAFTLGSYAHYQAQQATLGANSAVTSQYGFLVNSTLTGATNNYGFYGNIAAGTNRFNFFAAGTANNFFAGNLGLGLTPITKLHIYGAGANTAFYANGDASGSTAYLQSSGSVAGEGGQILFGSAFGVHAGIKGFLTNGTGPAGDLIFQTRTTSGNVIERMRINSTGGVGIGTSSVAGTFAVQANNAGGTTISSIINTSGTANSQAVLSFDPGANGFNLRDSQIRARNNGSNQTSLEFYTANGAPPAEHVRITSTGDVGIGTTTPSTKLDVVGGLTVSGNTVLSSTGAIKIPSGTEAQKAGYATVGMIRFNTTSNSLEVYKSTGWGPVSSAAASIGFAYFLAANL
jgi:hypothetical protein